MSDLISRSELLKEIEKYKFGAISNDVEREYIKKTILDFIIGQPTAYDVDGVVEELEKLKDKGSVTKTEKLITKSCVDKAIEIVKHGGVAVVNNATTKNDYVCEWRLCDEEANVYDTSCRNPHILIEGTTRENNYKYCPYCGKKIKEVK